MPGPNVVLITCHDLGRHLACYGVQTVASPHIDALAASGVRFADVFCVAPQCSPSRSTIYTGRYPHSNGVMGLAHAGFAWEYHPGERHLSNLLGAAGWTCVLVGVQHETRDPERMEYERIVMADVPSCVAVAEDAARVIAGHASERPLYLQVGFLEPHRPFDLFGIEPDDSLGITVPDYLVDEPGAREEFAGFQGAVRKLDRAVARIVEALEDAGFRDDTLIVFTTDHGIPFPRAKCSLYDPGLEVCLVLSWPGAGWPAGSVRTELISNLDLAPTILDLCRVDAPADVQGRSFAGLLAGQPYEPRAEVFAELTYHDYFDPRRCIRTRDHKLIVNFSNAPFFMDPSQSWRPKTTPRHPPLPAFHDLVELYDLRADPLEFDNLAGRPELAPVQAELTARLREQMAATGDPLLDGIPPSPMHRSAIAVLQAAAVRAR